MSGKELLLDLDFSLDSAAGSAAYSILATGELVLLLLAVVLRNRKDEDAGAWSCRIVRERASEEIREGVADVFCLVVLRHWRQTKGEAEAEAEVEKDEGEDSRDSWLASPRRPARRIGAGCRYAIAAGSEMRLQRQYSSREQTHWMGLGDAEALGVRKCFGANLRVSAKAGRERPNQSGHQRLFASGLIGAAPGSSARRGRDHRTTIHCRVLTRGTEGTCSL